MQQARGYARMDKNGTHDNADKARYFPVSPLMLFQETRADFRVYLLQEDKYVLYTKEQQKFDERLRSHLYNLGVTMVYVLQDQKEAYEHYIEDNLGHILENSDIPIEERSKTFYDASVSVLDEIFSAKLPETLSEKLYSRILKLVSESINFLSTEEALKSISKLLKHDYKTFTHSVHVFTYALAVMHTYTQDEDMLKKVGMGAILHDLGKARIPKTILDNYPQLTPEEMEQYKLHPLHGVAMCSMIPLDQDAVNCVLFHHERMDGTGYPTQLRGDNIPLPVRIVTVCNEYDAMTTTQPGERTLTPFEALNRMRDRMAGYFDPEVYKRLILVLSGAEII